MHKMTRRTFIEMAGLAGAAVAAGCARMARRRDDYAVTLIGDTHFDGPRSDIYHTSFLATTKTPHLKTVKAEFVRNGEMWAERLPALMGRAGELRRAETAFAFQLGDLIQGDCGDADIHRKMLDDAFAKVKAPLGGLPLITLIGNHDYRGYDGGRKTYNEWLPSVVRREMGLEIQSANYIFTHGPDLFLVLDFERPDFDLIRRALADHADARHKFVFAHGPLIPNNSGDGWNLFTRWGVKMELRREMVSLLLRHRVKVIAGHTHRVEFSEIANAEGRVTQFVGNCCWSKSLPTPPFKLETDKVGDLGSRIPDKPGVREYFDFYRPLVKRLEVFAGAGLARLDVSDHRVSVDFYAGLSEGPVRTFEL